MAVLRGDDTGFIAKIFQTDIVQNQLRNQSSATINQIIRKDFERVVIPLPPFQERVKIAETITAFDTHIENLSALIEKKRAVRDGALEDLISGRTRLAGFNNEWKHTTLGTEFTVIMGQSPPSSSYNLSKEGLPLVQGNADIKNGITVPERYTLMPTRICGAGAVLLSVRAPVGTVSKANQTVCLGRGVCAVIGSNNAFIYQMMKYYEKSWEIIGQGSTFTAISGKEVRNFEIKIPDDKEQEAIAAVLTAMDREIAALEEERDKIAQIREGAMDDLLTGRVRLKV